MFEDYFVDVYTLLVFDSRKEAITSAVNNHDRSRHFNVLKCF